jgi:hypothetical protein
MKCIDDELVQRYIDGETDLRETEEIEKHIITCLSCARSIEERKALLNTIKTDLQKLVSLPVSIPEFSVPVAQKRRLNIKIKHMVYTVSAACIALCILLFPFTERHEEEEENNILLVYSVIRDFDANRTFSQQKQQIFMIDSEGKIIEFY